MHKSIFFRRLLVMLLLALLLWTLMTAVFYNHISRPIFTKIKVSEMQPKAKSLAALAGRSFLQGDPYFDSLVQSSYELFDAWTFVIDSVTQEIYAGSLPEEAADSESDIHSQIISSSSELLDGSAESLWFTYKLPGSAEEMLFVGVPVNFRFGQQTGIIGALYFVKPMSELNAGFRSMNIALITASITVFIIMLLPLYFAAARLIKPLKQTRDVALAMASGNFTVRAVADIRKLGEIGELALIMNHLADKLADSISELTTERNRLRQIIDCMAEGILATDRYGNIILTNSMVWSLLGLDKLHEQATPQQIMDHDNLKETLLEVMGTGEEKTIIIRTAARIIACQVAPIEEANGVIAGSVALFRDITESERLEQTRRDYVANISHELRTPLTAMRALLEPLSDNMVRSEEDRKRYYQILLKETIRLSRLINDMLDLSRLQAGSDELNMQSFSPAEMLRELIMKYENHAEDLGIHLILTDNTKNCPAAYGNPERIEQVLVILLDNALKYTPENGSIELAAQWDEYKITISVKDSGPGIELEDIDHVFDRFYKADKAHRQPGTGLGLAIAREIMTRHGEAIWVRSEAQQGARFCFTLRRSDNVDMLNKKQ
jgi:two-component system sensor histidine kinase ResE